MITLIALDFPLFASRLDQDTADGGITKELTFYHKNS
jgi:hypothetical protein